MKVPSRKLGRDNLFRCTYVLPDGVTHTKGYVKDPDAAKRYLNPIEAKDTLQPDTMGKLEDRKRIDLSKNVVSYFLCGSKSGFSPFHILLTLLPSTQEFDLTNERFLVPEMIFQPADLGLYHVLAPWLLSGQIDVINFIVVTGGKHEMES